MSVLYAAGILVAGGMLSWRYRDPSHPASPIATMLGFTLVAILLLVLFNIPVPDRGN